MPSFSPHVKRQLAILVICRFAEPFALTSVWPYLYFMVKSFNVPEKDIPRYVGLIAASFNICQFLTGIAWGRVADRYGRKPMILVGLLGTFIASMTFGFSSSLWMAMTARAMAGGLNGNVGILRTMVAELVREKELQPRAFSLMPLTWMVASTIAPIMGGYLSEPVKKYPSVFPPGGILEAYPFALPNIVCCGLFAFAMIFGLFFIEETLESKKHQPDVFVMMGRRFTAWLFPRSAGAHRETQPLLSDDEERYLNKKIRDEKQPTVWDAFTKQSTLNIIIYYIVALHVTYDQLLPVFLSTPPVPEKNQHPPFRFAGGFGFTSNQVGSVFSIFGALGMTVQFFFFPPIARKYGALKCLRVAFSVFPITFILAPYTVLAPKSIRAELLVALTAVKKIAEVFIFPCITIMVTNSAPSLKVLGTLNGVATAAAALGRSTGPTTGGFLFSTGQKIDLIILPYFSLALVTAIGFIPLAQVVEMEGPRSDEDKEDDETSLAEASTLLNVDGDVSGVNTVEEHRRNCPICAGICGCGDGDEVDDEGIPPLAPTSRAS